MKKTLFNFLILGSFVPFLVQCASQQDLEQVRYQLRIVNKKLEDMKANTVDQLQKRQAAASGQVDQVEQDILSLKSQLEETYHLNQRLKEQNKELEATIASVVETEASKREEALKKFEASQREKELRLTQELNEKLRLQQESVNAIQQARIKDAERRAKEAALAAELAKTRSNSANAGLQSSGSPSHIRLDQKKIKLKVSNTSEASAQAKPSQPEKVTQPAKQQPVTAPVSTSTTKDSASNDFNNAQKLYNKGNFKEAFKLYEQIAVNPSASDTVEARFMMGECLFQQKEYDKAIMQYQNIISQHPDNAKAPEAMLKQGMAFEKLADKDTAKVIYKKLLKKYSSSSEAATAQKKLDTL
jgi:tol-pal system protein YbgF